MRRLSRVNTADDLIIHFSLSLTGMKAIYSKWAVLTNLKKFNEVSYGVSFPSEAEAEKSGQTVLIRPSSHSAARGRGTSTHLML